MTTFHREQFKIDKRILDNDYNQFSLSRFILFTFNMNIMIVSILILNLR